VDPSSTLPSYLTGTTPQSSAFWPTQVACPSSAASLLIGAERPATVADRAVPGHWEGDFLFGDCNSQIATLVERHTRYAMLVKVASEDTETVISALIKNARQLPQEFYQSLTWDRGKEMADHKRFTLATDIRLYFCDPHSPWQRGRNENTNAVLRQYFLDGVNVSECSQTQLNALVNIAQIPPHILIPNPSLNLVRKPSPFLIPRPSLIRVWVLVIVDQQSVRS
jgi:hypothetical protein